MLKLVETMERATNQAGYFDTDRFVKTQEPREITIGNNTIKLGRQLKIFSVLRSPSAMSAVLYSSFDNLALGKLQNETNLCVLEPNGLPSE